MIDEHRVWTNMLSTMPLAFNLFGGLKLNRELAQKVCRALKHLRINHRREVARLPHAQKPQTGRRTRTSTPQSSTSGVQTA